MNNSTNQQTTTTNVSDTTVQEQISDPVIGLIEEEAAPNVSANLISKFRMYPGNDSNPLQFFSRPVNIYSYTINPGYSQNTFQPYALWRTNPTILRKLVGYKNFRGNLKMKVIWTTNPYQTGLTMISGFYNTTGFAVTDLNVFNPVRLSQSPAVAYIELNRTSSVEMSIPFFWPTPFLNVSQTVNSTTDFSNIATCCVTELAPLINANLTTPSPVTLVFYAWMEDVVLDVPTSYVAQSSMGETKSEFKISTAARAIGTVASTLSNVPIIGNFASTVSSVANTVSSVASFFGFSKPDGGYVTNLHLVRQFGNMSITNLEDTSTKMALFKEQSNPITQDYLIGSDEDPLLIKNIACRYSLLQTVSWASTQSIGTQIMALPVTPMYSYPTTDGLCYQTTSLGYVAGLFNYWSGGITYRVKIISTQFHRGKIQVWYDPESTYTAPTVGEDPTVANRNFIIDISTDNDFEFTIPQSSRHGCLRTWAVDQTSLGTQYVGGQWRMRVIDPLTSMGSGTTTIVLAIWVKGAADFCVSGPSATPYIAQINTQHLLAKHMIVYPYSSMPDSQQELNLCMPAKKQVDLLPPRYPPQEFMSIMFGETCVSLRNLLTRYTFRSCHTPLNTNTSVVTSPHSTFYNYTFPVEPISAAMNKAQSGLSTRNTNSTVNTNMIGLYWQDNLHYILCAFAGFRGSFRHKIIVEHDKDTSVPIWVMRNYENDPKGEFDYFYPVGAAANIGDNGVATDFSRWMAQSNIGLQQGFSPTEYNKGTIEVSIPYTDTALFHSTNFPGQTGAINSNTAAARVIMLFKSIATGTTLINSPIFHYMAAGDDISAHVFQGQLPLVDSVTMDSASEWVPSTGRVREFGVT